MSEIWKCRKKNHDIGQSNASDKIRDGIPLDMKLEDYLQYVLC